jgi:hypothetical protein
MNGPRSARANQRVGCVAREPEPEDPILSFYGADLKAVQRVLDRAQRAAARANAKPLGTQSLRPGVLSRALDTSLAAYGRTAASKASIRITAPDTGGRPYHFGLSTVTKGKRAKRGTPHGGAVGSPGQVDSGGKGSAGKPSRTPGSGKYKAKTREGAHQAYAERNGAVERDNVPIDTDRMLALDSKRSLDMEPGDDIGRAAEAPGRDGTIEIGGPNGNRWLEGTSPNGPVSPELEADGPDAADRDASGTRHGRPSARSAREDRDREPSAEDWVEETMRDKPGLSSASSEAAAQAYVEHASKVSKVRGTTSSFGTLGNTLEERMAFWDLVHEHESSAGGRTQSRLVLELPHEASPHARHEMVRRYVKEFEERGVPYWATIHEPTKDNDSRNYHAHVVFTDRPMAMMDHPDTGERVWDFTVEEAFKDTTRHTRIRHPYRQNRDPEMRDRGWVKRSRSRFAGIVNDVMVENDLGVRYDPRSYKDMGLDVPPMKNVDRILTDRSKTQRFVVMDPEWTRRMIDAEMREAALRRDETYQQLREIEARIQDAARLGTKTRQANARLPRGMAIAPGKRVTPRLADGVAGGLLEVERARLSARFMDEATERTLTHVLEATGPKRTARGEARTAPGADAPDPETMSGLHGAALEELAAFRVERAAREKGFRSAGRLFMDAWKRGTTTAAPSAGSVPAQADSRRGAKTEPAKSRASSDVPDVPAVAGDLRTRVAGGDDVARPKVTPSPIVGTPDEERTARWPSTTRLPTLSELRRSTDAIMAGVPN